MNMKVFDVCVEVRGVLYASVVCLFMWSVNALASMSYIFLVTKFTQQVFARYSEDLNEIYSMTSNSREKKSSRR